MNSIESKKETIIRIGKQIYEKGLTVASEGNISCRLDEDHILITSTGSHNRSLKKTDICILDLSTKIETNTLISSEAKMHVAIYQCRQDIKAIVHAHPPLATSFASAGENLISSLTPESIIVLGTQIPLVEYHQPSSHELANAVANSFKSLKVKAILLANHGAVTVSDTLDNAYDGMEILEHLAYINLNTKIIGKQSLLPECEIKKLLI